MLNNMLNKKERIFIRITPFVAGFIGWLCPIMNIFFSINLTVSVTTALSLVGLYLLGSYSLFSIYKKRKMKKIEHFDKNAYIELGELESQLENVKHSLNSKKQKLQKNGCCFRTL